MELQNPWHQQYIFVPYSLKKDYKISLENYCNIVSLTWKLNRSFNILLNEFQKRSLKRKTQLSFTNTSLCK